MFVTIILLIEEDRLMYVKLFDDLLDSTIWMEKDHVVRVWLALLLLANREGFVEIPIPALASRARVDLDDCAGAIARLESPDPYSRTALEEGRRILRVTADKTLWKIVNYEYYRALRSAEQKRKYQRLYMKDYRRRKKEALQSEEKLTESLQSDEKSNELAHAEAEASAEFKKTTSSSSSRGDDSEFVKKVVEFWKENDLRPRLRAISPARRSMILARRREYGEDSVMEALQKRADSNFLCNGYLDGRGAAIDFVFGPKNFAKVLDGNYDNKGGGGPSKGGASVYDSTL